VRRAARGAQQARILTHGTDEAGPLTTADHNYSCFDSFSLRCLWKSVCAHRDRGYQPLASVGENGPRLRVHLRAQNSALIASSAAKAAAASAFQAADMARVAGIRLLFDSSSSEEGHRTRKFASTLAPTASPTPSPPSASSPFGCLAPLPLTNPNSPLFASASLPQTVRGCDRGSAQRTLPSGWGRGSRAGAQRTWPRVR